MTDTPNPETEEPSAEDALKRRLLNRIAIAAVMVVGLLGSLAMFDALNAPPKLPAQVASLPPKPEPPPVLEPRQEEAPPAAAPADAPPTAPAEGAAAPAGTDASASAPAAPAAPPATPATATAAAKPGSGVAAVPAAPGAVARPEVPAVPERTASPGAPPLQALPAEKPLTKPATSRPAAIRPSEPVAAATSPAARPDPVQELAVPRRAPASRPVTQAAQRQFAIQMGVFNNLANAEDLRATLELHGIPSTIEARVHVGPFKTRAEADAARAKLKELGMESGMLVTMKK